MISFSVRFGRSRLFRPQSSWSPACRRPASRGGPRCRENCRTSRREAGRTGPATTWTSTQPLLVLDEVDTETVAQLTERWSYEVAAGIDIGQVTPLVIDGVMYFHAGPNVIAIDAVTGEEVWSLELNEARRNRVRGPTYAEGKIYAYNGPSLVAADAKTGELSSRSATAGVLPVVGLALQTKYPDIYPPTLDPHELGYRITAAPAYHDGTLYVGPRSRRGTFRVAW